MKLTELNNRSHGTKVAGMQSIVFANNANFGYQYSLGFHHSNTSTDSATFFSILYHCISFEGLSIPLPELESSSISLNRFSFGSHVVSLAKFGSA